MKSSLFVILVSLIISHQGEAKTFKNSYINFNLPEKWNCQLVKKAYLCRYRVSKTCKQNSKTEECKKQIKKSREAMIVLSAKEKSDMDTIESFHDYFGNFKKIKSSGSSSQSKVVHNKFVGINNLKWIDGMHLGSELPHYYTRYLATINGDVAVLVTFSAHKLYYTNYSSQFFSGIKSLKVTASKINQVSKKELGNKTLSRPIDIPQELMESSYSTENDNKNDSNLLFLLSLGLLITGLFIWFRSRKR